MLIFLLPISLSLYICSLSILVETFSLVSFLFTSFSVFKQFFTSTDQFPRKYFPNWLLLLNWEPFPVFTPSPSQSVLWEFVPVVAGGGRRREGCRRGQMSASPQMPSQQCSPLGLAVQIGDTFEQVKMQWEYLNLNSISLPFLKWNIVGDSFCHDHMYVFHANAVTL